MTDIPHALIRNALRKIWWERSKARREALKRQKVKGSQLWICEGCAQLIPRKHVDHIVPIGKTPGAKGSDADWNGFFDRLFCPSEGLQILCKACHDEKTKTDKQGIK